MLEARSKIVKRDALMRQCVPSGAKQELQLLCAYTTDVKVCGMGYVPHLLNIISKEIASEDVFQ